MSAASTLAAQRCGWPVCNGRPRWLRCPAPVPTCSLSRLRATIRAVRRDISRLQKDRTLLQAATNYRPNVRRS